MKVALTRRLAFRVLAPILLFGVALTLGAIGFANYAVSSFVERQASSDLRWRANSVQQIIDSNVDELQRTGRARDEVALRQRKVMALLAIEDFARVNSLRVAIHDAVEQRTDELGMDLPSGDARFARYAFHFTPWQWEVTLTQDNRAYLAVFRELFLVFGVAGAVFVAGVIGFMFYLTALTQRPIRAIVSDLERNQSPRYEGIAEFEYLSGSIATMMGAIRQQVTERKQAEAERQARQAAESANRAKSVFLANMSHELRTPLNAVLGYGQILSLATNLTERQAKGVQTILRSGEHLLALIDEVLDLARVEAGKLELHPGEFAPARFLQGIADIIRVRAEQKGLAFAYEAAADLPDAVHADEQRLRQVLLNLLGNAVKFTDQGQVTLRVKTMRPTSPGSGAGATLRFEVHDSGVGIAAEQVETLFQPFQQVGDLRRQRGGTGLGLAISRQLVQLMGSDITVNTELGRGSVFAFDLHLPTAPAEAEPAVLDRMPVGYAGPRRKVLVVDDVDANREVLVEMLRPLGFAMFEATDGAQGLAHAQSLQPDVILMDNVMPVLDGLEATRSLRAMPAFTAVPIIAISASASKADEQRALVAGATAFLSKPFRAAILFALLEQHLGLQFIYDQGE